MPSWWLALHKKPPPVCHPDPDLSGEGSGEGRVSDIVEYVHFSTLPPPADRPKYQNCRMFLSNP